MLTTNDILYKIKKALGLTEEQIIEAYTLEGFNMNPEHLQGLLKPRKNRSYVPSTYEELGIFLDGLVTLKRGRSSQQKDESEEVVLTNNLVLKKLRAALELKEFEIQIVFELVDVELSKQQLSSLFRKEGHKNFKPCSDELLTAFLDGLDEFYFTGNELE